MNEEPKRLVTEVRNKLQMESSRPSHSLWEVTMFKELTAKLDKALEEKKYEPFPKCSDCGEVWKDHVC